MKTIRTMCIRSLGLKPIACCCCSDVLSSLVDGQLKTYREYLEIKDSAQVEATRLSCFLAGTARGQLFSAVMDEARHESCS